MQLKYVNYTGLNIVSIQFAVRKQDKKKTALKLQFTAKDPSSLSGLCVYNIITSAKTACELISNLFDRRSCLLFTARLDYLRELSAGLESVVQFPPGEGFWCILKFR